jgi:hypothetical protein
MSISELEVEGGKARVRAEMCLQKGRTHGLLHARYGVLAVAAELHGTQETLHLVSPKKWFDRNRETFSCGQ